MTETTAPKAAPKTQQAQARAEDELPTYEVDYLVENARSLLNSTRPVVAGALAAKAPVSAFSIKDAVAAVKDYRGDVIVLDGEEQA